MKDDSRTGYRRRSKARRLSILGGVGLAAIGTGLAAGVWFNRVGEPDPQPSPSASTTEDVIIPRTVHLLLISSTFDGQTVLSTAPLLISEPVAGVQGGRDVLVVDPALRVIGPSGDSPLREHAAAFGPQGLSAGLRNELGLRIDSIASTTESDLVKFLRPFGEVAITLDRAIVEDGETIYTPGSHNLDPAELITFLAFPFQDDSIDAAARNELIASAWRGIASLPRLASRAGASGLSAETKEAFKALTRTESVEPVAVTDTDRGPVLDEVGFGPQASIWQGGWLLDLDPASRPRIELRGKRVVEVMLLLIADGFRIDDVRAEDGSESMIETEDESLGSRISELLDLGNVRKPTQPLLAGLDARVTFRGGA